MGVAGIAEASEWEERKTAAAAKSLDVADMIDVLRKFLRLLISGSRISNVESTVEVERRGEKLEADEDFGDVADKWEDAPTFYINSKQRELFSTQDGYPRGKGNLLRL